MGFTLDCDVKLCSYSPEDGCQLKMKSNLKDWELATLTYRLLLMQGDGGNRDEKDKSMVNF
uniref:Uncharacterized protein n=1 Tax=Solanum tuberosum TaxID=4113 RepID=M1B7C6_SOLTU